MRLYRSPRELVLPRWKIKGPKTKPWVTLTLIVWGKEEEPAKEMEKM